MSAQGGAPRPWARAAKVLCVRLDTLGDVLMTTPALRAVKGTGRGRRVVLLTSSLGAEIAGLVPEVDGVIVYDAPWMKATPERADGGGDRALVEELRRQAFDAAIIFTVYSQSPLPSALLCHLADVPLRLAYCHENPYQLLTDWIPDPEPAQLARHEVRRQLDLVAAVGCATEDERLSLRPPLEAFRAAQGRLAEAGVAPGVPWVLVHPGASAASRRYPASGFAQVGRALVREGLQIVFSGRAHEAALIEDIRQAMRAPSASLAGRVALAEFAAVVALAPLLISNNTAPVHIAAAVSTPVVDLYALTNPQHTPWMVPHRVLFHDVSCKYCYKSVCPEGHHRCLRLVAPAEIVRAALELLQSSSGPASPRLTASA